MAEQSEIDSFKLRQPSLPVAISDAVIGQYLDDAAIDFPQFGIATSHPAYLILHYLYAAHLMVVNGLLKDLTAAAVKDVSASFAIPPLAAGETRFYQAFKMTLKRNKSPGFILIGT
jgi:hypothetical protein